MNKVMVEVPGGAYPVLIGENLLGSVESLLPPDARRVVVVTQESVPYALDFAPRPSKVLLVPPTEAAKKLEVVQDLLEEVAAFGLSRSDAIVALGGGVVSDLAGFVASIYFRGIRYVNVATTLLSQVDAAIGGKTGVNLSTGKNLVGTFWQPSAVVCDVETLSSLADRELSSGFGEMAKYEFLGSGKLDMSDMVGSVTRCVQIKARYVAGDEREGAERAMLNYGHTMGHAIEALGISGAIGYLYHGEAVALGLVFAAHLALVLGRIDVEEVERHYEVVDRFALSSVLPSGVTADAVMAYLARDKKARGSITFVLADRLGSLEVVSGISGSEIQRAIESMRSWPRK